MGIRAESVLHFVRRLCESSVRDEQNLILFFDTLLFAILSNFFFPKPSFFFFFFFFFFLRTVQNLSPPSLLQTNSFQKNSFKDDSLAPPLELRDAA